MYPMYPISVSKTSSHAVMRRIVKKMSLVIPIPLALFNDASSPLHAVTLLHPIALSMGVLIDSLIVMTTLPSLLVNCGQIYLDWMHF